jgi:uncharacterized membrane protein
MCWLEIPMSADSVFHTLHVLAASIWITGMLVAWIALRPATLAGLSEPLRLQRLVSIFPRVFGWVWVAVLILPISGVVMMRLRFAGFETAPRHVQLMIGLYVVMVALFLRMHGLQLPVLRKAVASQAWTEGTTAVTHMRRLVAVDLLLGLAVVVVAVAWPL